MYELLITGPLAAILAAFFIHRCRIPAERLGLVDAPGGRKVHEGHTPLVGGIGMFVAFACCALLLGSSLQPYRGLFAGMALLLVSGVLDDLQDLRPKEHFVIQMLAAGILVIWGGLTVESLGVVIPTLGPLEFGLLAVPFTLLCVVGLINAINMKDGADGLAGSVTLVMLFWLSVIGTTAGDPSALALPVLLACSVLGFLAFNFPHRWRPRASVFMGNSGSMVLGFAVAWFAIELTFQHGTGVPPVTIAWILALPVFDTISLMLRRVAKGQNPMAGDREHLHHVFQRVGFSSRETVYILAGISFAMGAVGVGGWWSGVPEWTLWPPLLAVFALHYWFVRHAWRSMRLHRHERRRRREVV